MIKRRTTLSRTRENDLELISEGRGQGAGANYKPWLLVHQERSDCTSLRYYLPLTGRVHHLLTRANINYFFDLSYDDTVTDIREYYAL